MTLSLRAARPGEAPLILAFVHELAAYEKLSDEVDATEIMIDAALFAPGATTFCEIAEWSGEPIGFALWFLNFSSFRGRNGIYLEDLYVRPSHRGRGAGRALLRHLARKCVTEGWARLEWAVLDWNAPAIAFYQALGATVRDDWTLCQLTNEALSGLAGRE